MAEDIGVGVCKRILHAGHGPRPDFINGSKATFHFRTQKRTGDDDDDVVVLDDSQKAGRPMELIFGKEFKLPVWERCLETMLVGEVARFTVNKRLVDAYPFVAKSYRQYAGIAKGDRSSSHCCGMMALKDGVGSSELDELIRCPTDLEFVFELLKMEAPQEYEKDAWAMEPEEKLASVPKLREEGNLLYQEKKYTEASAKYAEALGRLEQLLLREKPGEPEWVELDRLKVPLLLNYSQCKLLEKDYYAVIEHTTSVLKIEPDNVKALFRRAKAHVGAWNPGEAKTDFQRVAQLDSSLETIVKHELQAINEMERQKTINDRRLFEGKMFAS